MRVSIDIPPPPRDGLDQAMTRQFAQMQRQLVKAMERLMGMVGQSVKAHPASHQMVAALHGMQHTMASLPKALISAAQRRPQTVAVRPHVTVKMPQNIVHRLDALHAAMVNSQWKSRSRTFGSNY